MLKITRHQDNELLFYEATFFGQNLFSFTIADMVNQLIEIYGFKCSLFNFKHQNN